MVQLCGQAEVADSDLEVVGEEEVSQLKVSVDDHLFLKVFYSQSHLFQVVSGFDLGYSFPSLDQLIQSLSRE